MAENGKAMFAEERRRLIVELVNTEKKIVIPELCDRLGVSASTIRNDLRDLQEEGKITRTHGGAIINSQSGFEPLPLDKETRMLAEKRAIGKLAARYVGNGDILAVTTGTTTFEFIRQLDTSLQLTIITNDIYFATYLERIPKFQVMLLGGTLRKDFHYVQLPSGNNYLAGVNIDKVFIACNGIHVKRGITTPDPHLAFDIQQLIAVSNELYVLCDHSKFGSASFSRITGLENATAVLTDNRIDGEDVTAFRNVGTELTIAPLE